MKKEFVLPEDMAAIEIRDGKLHPTRRPVPTPAASEVLVRVAAAGINRPDILQRKGVYPPPAGVTDIPGLEISGTVVAKGKSARGVRNGQAICALTAGGGYAEYCAVPAAQCLPVPKSIGMIAAAGMPETFFTVWRNLFDIAGIKKGDTVLIHGGASGIGTTAIQMAKHAGARVFITAGSDEKCRGCRKLGADLSINYKRFDFVGQVMTATKGRGVDIILDMVGGDYVPRNLKILAPHGRHVSIAVQQGRKCEVDLLDIMQRQITLTGSTLRAQPVATKAAIARHLRKKIWPLVSARRITPVIDRIFPLADAQGAHDYMESGVHFGKIILKI
jgi:putative PIG3 family NAD(P)H quinone oxidoreductase